MKKIILLAIFVFSGPLSAMVWPQVSDGKLERYQSFKSEHVPDRTIEVWLPPGYNKNNQYPVIYMHDGQMLFDTERTWNGQSWDLDKTVTSLINNRQVKPFIIVGIYNGGGNRHSEYFPQKPFLNMPQDLQNSLYDKTRGGENKLFQQPVYSDLYLAFIVKELMPFIEKNYSVNSDASYLMGSSMGGLISWYGLLEYPEIFRGAAALSTHWPGDFSHQNNPIPTYFQAYIKQNLHRLNKHKIYFDFGTETLDALYPALQEPVDKIFVEHKYPIGYWISREFTGTNHSENAWAERVDLAIRFLLNQS
ncbi:alpha/beta hydrolase [Gayadomonas joobiniege]|uniref:alpha/beta hydrolase n=1 Tax=Gayadomonas joobiniege TaxID=1234606 RepID=UPI0003612E70|nr:alpha/beta hydrolase-fold protein [Gayadomonas joobiniege]